MTEEGEVRVEPMGMGRANWDNITEDVVLPEESSAVCVFGGGGVLMSQRKVVGCCGFWIRNNNLSTLLVHLLYLLYGRLCSRPPQALSRNPYNKPEAGGLPFYR